LPFIKELGTAIATPLAPFIGLPLAGLTATVVLFLVPGFAGFLVWELKENWRLYRSNQPATLQPEIVGHHGETVLRLMKPGFHSGTLPKLYAKLRRNEGRAARKQRLALHHVRERLVHFAERDLIAYLDGSKCFPKEACLQVAEVSLATNRIRLFLACPGLSEEKLALDLEERSGRLVAGFSEPGWLGQLTPEQTWTFRDALVGFYKMAGVDVMGAEPPGQELVFNQVPIRWVDWVDVWEHDQAGKGHEPPLLPDERFLPGLSSPLGPT
jgi:hypothetical protein